MKKKRWLLLVVMLIAVMVLSVTANAAKVKLNKTKVTLTVGKTAQLKITGTKAKVKWASSNKKVAAVTSKGKVTAKNAGSATIKAKVGSGTYKCKITVKAAATTPQAKPSLSAAKLELVAGQQKQLFLNNASGNVTWSSSNHRVADVASDGTIYARFYGTCVIRATCGGKTYTCAVAVTFPDPECYPKTNYSYPDEGFELKIDAFEAGFIAYQPDSSAAVTIEDGNRLYFFPCIYRIHLKGNCSVKDREIGLYLVSSWDGRMHDEFQSCKIAVKTDENGDYDTTQDIKFSGPVERIYIVW